MRTRKKVILLLLRFFSSKLRPMTDGCSFLSEAKLGFRMKNNEKSGFGQNVRKQRSLSDLTGDMRRVKGIGKKVWVSFV